MLIVMPVAIKTHLHNVCAKNNYELLIAQEPTENARSDGGGGRGRCLQDGCIVCADGGTALNHRTKKKRERERGKKNRFEEPCVQIQAAAAAPACTGIYLLHSTKAFSLPNETDMYTPVFSLLLLFVWLSLLFIFADGEMEGIWGAT